MNKIHKSLNLETGMVEDVEDIRSVGIESARALQLVLQTPGLRMLVPAGVIQEAAVFAVKSESMLRPMTQREQYLLISQASGVPPEAAVFAELAAGGLSDTLPATHPQVRDRLLQNILSNPNMPEDFKREAMRMYKDSEKQAKQLAPPTALPPEIESFLRGLGGNEKES